MAQKEPAPVAPPLKKVYPIAHPALPAILGLVIVALLLLVCVVTVYWWQQRDGLGTRLPHERASELTAE